MTCRTSRRIQPWRASRLMLLALLLLTACGRGSTEMPAPSTPQPTVTATTSATIAATPTGTAAPSVTATSTTAVDTAAAGTATPLAASPLTSPLATNTPEASVPIYGYQVLNAYPHDPQAFTQGLIWQNGIFYEGTGLRGRSTLRKVDPQSGEVLQSVALAEQYFGEGITIFGDKLYQLTWQSGTGFIYDAESLELLDEFTYPTEGWGITHDGEQLIMSDGSNTLYFWDPETLETMGQIDVTYEGQPVNRLNELEYIDGSIYANVWQTDQIVIIDPASGALTGVIDLTGLLPTAVRTGNEDVLNGIAYDAETERLFVTGKLWPQLFEIELTLD